VAARRQTAAFICKLNSGFLPKATTPLKSSTCPSRVTARVALVARRDAPCRIGCGWQPPISICKICEPNGGKVPYEKLVTGNSK
jgi:hypothetical protein